MDSIVKIQDYLKDYFEKEIKQFYNFDVWKRAFIEEKKAPNTEQARKLFDHFGPGLRPTLLMVDVKASPDEWAQCCHITYGWRLEDAIVPITVMLEKDSVLYVQINDMFAVVAKYGENADFVSMFEKTVVLMNALKGK